MVVVLLGDGVQLLANPLAFLGWFVQERKGRVGVGTLVAQKGPRLVGAVLGTCVVVTEDRHQDEEKEKNDEEVRFSAFSQWCTNTKKSKTDEINAGNQKMEELKDRKSVV